MRRGGYYSSQEHFSFMGRLPIILLISSLVSHLADGADWPQWRGPNRDATSAETGLLASWPPGGPQVAWKTNGLGEGYSSLAIVGGRIYTQGQRGNQEYVVAFDVKTGKKLWETQTTRSFSNDRGNGPRGTPTIDGDRLYAMAGDGTLVCLDTATGKTIWSQNVVQQYRASVIGWGMSESPLIDGERLIVMPGGRGASLISLNKRDGKLQWKTGDDEAGYSSGIVIDVGGVRQVITLSGEAAMS